MPLRECVDSRFAHYCRYLTNTLSYKYHTLVWIITICIQHQYKTSFLLNSGLIKQWKLTVLRLACYAWKKTLINEFSIQQYTVCSDTDLHNINTIYMKTHHSLLLLSVLLMHADRQLHDTQNNITFIFFYNLMSLYAHQSSTVECLRFYLPSQPHFRSSQQFYIQTSLQQCVFTQTKCFSVLSNVITWLKAANLLYCIYLLYADLKSLDNNIMLFKLTIHFILFNSILCCDINGI